jgi:hypothetical protein
MFHASFFESLEPSLKIRTRIQNDQFGRHKVKYLNVFFRVASTCLGKLLGSTITQTSDSSLDENIGLSLQETQKD